MAPARRSALPSREAPAEGHANAAPRSKPAQSVDTDHLANVVIGSDGQRYIVIDATALNGDGKGLLADLQALGLQHGSDWGPMVSGLMPVARLGALADVASLASAQQSLATSHRTDASQSAGGFAAASPSQGPVISQGDRAMGTDTARAGNDVDGKGVLVGVLSDSFNAKGGQPGDIAAGELPADTLVLQDYLAASASDEGRAMAQIVHDVAPGSGIRFATAFVGGQAGFANNILALARAGAKVIVDDVLYFAETAYQDGPIAQAVQQVTAMGVTFLSSAGNSGTNGYTGRFDLQTSYTALPGLNDYRSVHAFAPGQTTISVTLPAQTSVTFVLQWDNPAASVSAGRGATADIDLLVYRAGALQTLMSGYRDNMGGDPVEFAGLRNTTAAPVTFELVVALFAGAVPNEFRLMGLTNGVPITFGSAATDATNLSRSTLFGHAAALDAIGVGANYYLKTPAFDPALASPTVEGFSSVGPSTITWGLDGARLAAPSVRQAPTLTAPDGADTTFFGSDRDGNGLPNFSGTSAAAPHAAGLAALMLEANSRLTPADIRRLMQSSAIDQDDPGTPDFDTGYDVRTGSGMATGEAVTFARTGIIDNTVRANPVLYGTHLADVIIGGAGRQVVTGFGGADTYRGTAAHLNGDTITDFNRVSRIDVTDAPQGLGSLAYDAATGALSFVLSGTQMAGPPGVPLPIYTLNLPTGLSGTFTTRSNGSGGTEIVIEDASPISAPVAPTLRLDATSDTGASNADGITRSAHLLMTGTGTAGHVVSIYDDADGNGNRDAGEAVLATATVLANGGYSTIVTPGDGSHSLRAYQSGPIAESEDSAALVTFVDATAPTVTRIAANVAYANHAAALSGTVTFSEAVIGVDTSDFVVTTVNGTATARVLSVAGSGATYTVALDGITGEGAIRIDLKATGTGIADTIGNPIATGFVGGDTVGIDSIVPDAPVVSLTADTGISGDDRLTRDARITVVGREDGATLRYSVDGGPAAMDYVVPTTQGRHTVSVTQTDAAGNVSSAGTLAFVLDTLAPTALALALTNDTGSSATDRVTSDARLTVTGQEDGATLLFSVDGGPTDARYVAPATQGAHTVSVTQTDRAGNVSPAATLDFILGPDASPAPPTPPTTPVAPTSPAVPSTGGTASPSAGQTQTVSGITSGALEKTGAGTLILTGTNTYTGPTEVKAGTLVVNGSIVSPVSVASGATLGGSGSVGTVAIEGGGILSPGNSPGILSTRDLSLAAGAVLREEIGGTGVGQFDQLKVTGTVSLSGASLDVSAFGGFASTRGERFVLIDNDGTDAVLGTFAGLAEGATLSFGARSLRISYQGGDGNDVTLTDTTGLAFQREAFGAVVTNADSAAGQVYGLYEALLNRAPDPLGLSGFTTALENGASLSQVAGAILGSPEHGPAQTSTAFVESVYANVLNRPADAAGLQSWTGQLAAGASQAEVAVQIATSAEAKAVLAPTFANGVFVFDASEASVARLYYGLLDRAPDAGGLRGFSAFIETSGGGAQGEAGRLAQVATTILSSAEYAGRHAGQTDAGFVLDLYQDALGRAPDAGGQAGYLSALAHGASRAQVALDITQSPEAQAHWLGHIQDGTIVA